MVGPVAMTRIDAPSLPVVELRQYTLMPGKRDVLIELFEREFIEGQEAAGMTIVGTFRDLDRPDRFVWIRAFYDRSSRAAALQAFYDGPVWQANRDIANGTMLDSDNVLLLKPSREGSGFNLSGRSRPPRGATEAAATLVVGTIYSFDREDGTFVDFFERRLRPELEKVGGHVLASFVSDSSPNNFPRLPVREGEHVFVWWSSFARDAAYSAHLATLAASATWQGVIRDLASRLKGKPEILRLRPTARSLLRD